MFMAGFAVSLSGTFTLSMYTVIRDCVKILTERVREKRGDECYYLF